MNLDTGATTHAADRLDSPRHQVLESEGSKGGQTFGCAGGKKFANEGKVGFLMTGPGGIECELEATVPFTRVTILLL